MSKNYCKNKGDNAEREYAEKFRQLGFQFCKTSRQASRLLDDSGIDLSGIPFNVQIKSGYWKYRPKADILFKGMNDTLKANFQPKDPVHSYPKILIHKLDGKKVEHQLITMTWEDFLPFLIAYKEKYEL